MRRQWTLWRIATASEEGRKRGGVSEAGRREEETDATNQILVRPQGVAPAQRLDSLEALVDVSAEEGVVLVKVEVIEGGVDGGVEEEGLGQMK